ncbi:MAG: hypothetical protein JKY54_11645 [Flavobacteriales bacterium]|nr:hypothetical protein [Flavobacteriales bacterium]
MKIKIDQPELSDADILKHKNFGNVMQAVGKIQVPWYKTSKFWGLSGGGIAVATVTTLVVLTTTKVDSPSISEEPNPVEMIQLVELVATDTTSVPFPENNVPNEHHTIDPTVNNEIITEDGSILFIPANSILNNDETPATEKLDINYRDFYSAYEIFLAGIPMDIKDNGQESFLESAGMFELTTTGDYKIDSKNPIQVYFKSTSNDGSYDQYSLSNDGWSNDSPCKQTVIKDDINIEKPIVEEIKLAKPVLKNEDDPTILFGSAEIAQFEELSSYENVLLKFDKKDRELADRNIIWDDYKIERGTAPNTYVATLELNGKIYTPIGIPVFDHVAHEKAMKIYQAEVDRLAEKQKRKQQDVIQDNSNMSFSQLSAPARLILKNSNGTFQTFTLTGFGTFNCDRILRQQPKKFDIQFASKEERYNVRVVYSFMRGVSTVESSPPDEEIFIMPEDNSVIAFICEGNKMAVGYLKDLKIGKRTIQFPADQIRNKEEALLLLSEMI